MASRYDSVGGSATTPDSRSTSTGSTTSSGTSATTSSSSGTSNTSSKTDSLSGANKAALDALIQQLMSGGTPEMKRQRAVRNDEITDVRQQREGYSKQAAFGDAQGLIAQQMRRALEQMMPSISRASEDAGSSGGALRALLLQDAANKAAESSSALGVKTAVDYGNVSSNLSQVLERLTQVDSSTLQGLVNALGVAKGASVTSNSTTVENKVGSSATTENKSTQATESKATDYAPFGVTSPAARDTAPIYFGPADGGASAGTGIGSTTDFLNQLNGNAWSNYQF